MWREQLTGRGWTVAFADTPQVNVSGRHFAIVADVDARTITLCPTASADELGQAFADLVTGLREIPNTGFPPQLGAVATSRRHLD